VVKRPSQYDDAYHVPEIRPLLKDPEDLHATSPAECIQSYGDALAAHMQCEPRIRAAGLTTSWVGGAFPTGSKTGARQPVDGGIASLRMAAEPVESLQLAAGGRVRPYAIRATAAGRAGPAAYGCIPGCSVLSSIGCDMTGDFASMLSEYRRSRYDTKSCSETEGGRSVLRCPDVYSTGLERLPPMRWNQQAERDPVWMP
jgi:hypothetical protein